MSSRKLLSALLTLGAVATTSGVAALAVEFYRRPFETVIGAARLGMLATGAREDTIEVGKPGKAGQLPMHYYSMGRRGSPIVLVHGLGGSSEGWLNLMPRLSHDYLVYAPDMPGFGKTSPAPGVQSIAMQAHYLEYFLDALGYPRVTLVGNSLGGWIAARFAIDHPERVNQLYLLNSAGLMREGTFSPYAPNRDAARRYFRRWLGRPVPVPNFLLDAMVRNSHQPAYIEFIEKYDASEELDADLPHLQVPTTIIWGTSDHIFPLTCAEDFHKGIPHSRLILLKGVGHTPQFEAARAVAKVILRQPDP